MNSLKMMFIFLAFLSFSCKAQKKAVAPDSIVNAFFTEYKENGINNAIDNIFSGSDLDKRKALPFIKDTLAQTIKLVGERYYGQELIIKKSVTSSLCFYSYLVRYPISPLRFTFIFYTAENEWKLIKFSFDDNLSTEMEEIGRLYFLK